MEFSYLPLYTYPLLLLPMLVMRRAGWLWAIAVPLIMAMVTREALSFHLFFFPPFLFPLLLWALITLLVSLWKNWRKQPVNVYLTGAAVSTWMTFICLWIRGEWSCWRKWWC